MFNSYFKIGKEHSARDIILWCRQQFGNRGERWDFVGGERNLTIIVNKGSIEEMSLIMFSEAIKV